MSSSYSSPFLPPDKHRNSDVVYWRRGAIEAVKHCSNS